MSVVRFSDAIVTILSKLASLLPVRSMRKGYAFVSVCMCVIKKYACLRLTTRNLPQKRTLQLLH